MLQATLPSITKQRDACCVQSSFGPVVLVPERNPGRFDLRLKGMWFGTVQWHPDHGVWACEHGSVRSRADLATLVEAVLEAYIATAEVSRPGSRARLAAFQGR